MMIRRVLLGTVCTAALLSARAAHAQWPVTDAGSIVQSVKQVAQGAQQIQQLQTQITNMVQQLQQMQNIYGSLAHSPLSSLDQIGAGMNTNPMLRLPLPPVTSMPSVINGSGLATMGPLGAQFLSQNRIAAAPTGSDPASVAMNANANSIAGVEASASQLDQGAQSHIQALQQLEGALANSPDAKDTADISARVQLEQSYIASQQVQATALETWQQAQVRNVQEQEDETNRQDIDDVIQQGNAAITPGG